MKPTSAKMTLRACEFVVFATSCSYHLDSSSAAHSTATGALDTQRYKSFGEPRGPASTLPTDRMFTGQRSEEAGLGSLYD